MPFFEAGNWTVTTTDDAYGRADGHNDPATTDPREPWWCVYDANGDDEPIVQGATFEWARRVAQALYFTGEVLRLADDPSWMPPATEDDGMGEDPSPYDTVEHYGMWVTCCKACDGDHVMPMPFTNPEARQNWRNTHAVGAGHREFYEVDPDGARGTVSVLTRKTGDSPFPKVMAELRHKPHYYQHSDVNKGFTHPCCDEPRDADIHLPPRTDPHQYNWNNGVNPCCHESIDADIHAAHRRRDDVWEDEPGASHYDHPEPEDIELDSATGLGWAGISAAVTGF
jgi:hypothetical protein